jgi:neogenin
MELKNLDKGQPNTTTPGCSDASSSGAMTLPRSHMPSDYENENTIIPHVSNSLDKRSYVPGYMCKYFDTTD